MLSNLVFAQLCLFVIGATFAASNWQYNVAALLVASFWDFEASMAEWLVREIQIC